MLEDMIDKKVERIKDSRGRFIKGYKPKERSKEWRELMRSKLKGRRCSERNKVLISEKMKGLRVGEKHPLFGKRGKSCRNYGKVGRLKHSVEFRRRLSKRLAGSKGPLWKGGVTSVNKRIRGSLEWKLWREQVFERDNYTCQKCGKKGVLLHPHHIYNFSYCEKLRFEVSNGITFCRECHNLFHSIYGRKNNSPLQVINFLLGRSLE